MICTGCGAENPDEAAVCLACGRKLQSARDPRPAEDAPRRSDDVPLLPSPDQAQDSPAPRLRPYREAWLVGLGLAGVCFLLASLRLDWPLYPLLGLAAALALLRGLR